MYGRRRRYGRRSRTSRRRYRSKAVLPSMRSQTRRRMYRRKRGAIKYRKMGIAANIVPKNKLIKICYSQHMEPHALFSSDGKANGYSHSWGFNDIYDPDKNIGGHQPMLHDQMSLLYGNYVVVGAKYRFNLEFILNNSNATNFDSLNFPAIAAGIFRGRNQNNWPSYYSNFDTWKENARTTKEVSYSEHRVTDTQKTFSLTSYYNMKKFWDLDSNRDTESVYGADFNSSPSSVAYCNLYVIPTSNQISNQSGLYLRVNVFATFIVLCSNPLAIGQS